MLIHRDGWQYSGKTPAFFSGQSGCYCCGVGIGTYVCFYGANQTTGPLRDVDSYTVDSWTGKTDGPTPARRSLQGATVEGVAYIYGGVGNASPTYYVDTEAYVLSTDTFTAKADMSNSRYAGSGFAISQKAYLAFGNDSGTNTTRTLYEYDPLGDTWSTKTDGPTPTRSETASFVISSKGYVCGGAGGFLKDNDEYTASSDSWTSKTDMGTARIGPGGFTLDGTGWILMGFAASFQVVGTTEKYDASNNSWSGGPSLGFGRTSRYWSGSASPGSTTSGFMSAGLTGAATQIRQHDEIDNAAWTTRADIPTPARERCVALESV